MHHHLTHSLFTLFALLTTQVASAQYSRRAKVIFEEPARTTAAEPIGTLGSSSPCKLVLDITVDREGRMTTSKVAQGTGHCTDMALQNQALIQAKSYQFLPHPGAPEQHQGQLVWNFGAPHFEGIDVVMDDAPVMVVEPAHDPNEPLAYVDEMPSFPGGQEVMLAYIAKELRYPEAAKQNSVQGKVFLTVVVERDGQLTGAKVLRGIGGGCDEEALRVVQGMPKWTPGKQRGETVRVQYNIPVSFKL